MLRILPSAILGLIGAGLAVPFPITFEFRSLIDTTEVGGGPGAPISVIYTFDSTDGSVSFMRISIASEIITGSGGSISVGNNQGSGGHEDAYDVRPAVFSGPIFGVTPVLFRILLGDIDGDMFTN